MFGVFYYDIIYFTVPPGKPSNLSVTEITPKSINLTWSSQGHSISHYEVMFANESGNEIIHVSQTTSALIDKLSYNSKYRFQVVAVLVAGSLVERSPPSDPVYFSGKCTTVCNTQTQINVCF